MRFFIAVCLSCAFVGCVQPINSLDTTSDVLFQNEFAGRTRKDLVQVLGTPTKIETTNISKMNLVGSSQVLIPLEEKIRGLGGQLTEVRFDSGNWRTYIWELESGKIVASIRFDMSRVYMK
ncbi:MAG: hypothetical protein Q8O19_02730 [Rectinemataceae bacterium]|nr:hypothetical protein [Rectinemataceae bacterium]